MLSVGANEAIKNNYKDDAKAVAKKNRYNKILDIIETVKHNKHLHLLGVSENVIPYQLSNEEKERIENTNGHKTGFGTFKKYLRDEEYCFDS